MMETVYSGFAKTNGVQAGGSSETSEFTLVRLESIPLPLLASLSSDLCLYIY